MSEIRKELKCDGTCTAHCLGFMKESDPRMDALVCNEGCPLFYEGAEAIMGRLPNFLNRYIMKFAVVKWSWWNFTGMWRISEIFVADKWVQNMYPRGAKQVDLDFGLTIGVVIGHYRGPLYYPYVHSDVRTGWLMDEYVIVYWQGVRLIEEPCFVPLHEAWFYAPEEVWEYFMNHILNMDRDFTQKTMLRWYENSFTYRGRMGQTPGFYTIALRFGYIDPDYEDDVSGVVRILCVKNYRVEFVHFGKSHLSVRKLLFQFEFSGKEFWDQALSQFEVQLLDARHILDRQSIYGLPIEFYGRNNNLVHE